MNKVFKIITGNQKSNNNNYRQVKPQIKLFKGSLTWAHRSKLSKHVTMIKHNTTNP